MIPLAVMCLSVQAEMQSKFKSFAIILACGLFLAGCGGGGNKYNGKSGNNSTNIGSGYNQSA
jgi:hypothetical protein